MSKIAFCGFTLLIVFQLATAQEPPNGPVEPDDIIRVNTNLVQLRAVVIDKQGRAISGLSRDDFEILERGRAREISNFSIDRGADNKAPTSANRSMANGGGNSVSLNPIRTVVLFVDTFHLSTSSFLNVKKRLRQIVLDQLLENGLVAIVSPDGRLGSLQRFTADRRTLQLAIDKINPFSCNSSLFTPYLAAQVTKEDPEAITTALQILVAEESYQPTSEQAAFSYVRARAREIIGEETHRRKTTLQLMQSVTDSLAEMPGQRIVVVLSDGFTVLESGGRTAIDETQAVTGRAARSGVVIYTLAGKGLNTPAEFAASSSLGGSSINMVSRYLNESDRDQKDILKVLANDTGGEAFLNQNDLRNSFQNVLDATSVSYLLGYHAPSVSEDGKFRSVTIRLKNHPDYAVKSARGYAPFVHRSSENARTPRERLFQAMLSPLPVTQISVNSSADFLEREADQARVTLQVGFEGQALHYQQRGGKYHLQCEVAGALYDASGKLVKTFLDSIAADLSTKEMELAKKAGFRYGTRVDLKPGTYQARLGVLDAGNDLIGTSSSWIDVPDLTRRRLTLSSVFLASDSSTGGSRSRPKLIHGRPYAKGNDTIFYRFAAYNVDSSTDSKFQLEILAGEVTTFSSEWYPLSEKTIATDKKGVELGGQLRVRLTPGAYTLRVTLVSNKSRKSAQQVVDFQVADN